MKTHTSKNMYVSDNDRSTYVTAVYGMAAVEFSILC